MICGGLESTLSSSSAFAFLPCGGGAYEGLVEVDIARRVRLGSSGTGVVSRGLAAAASLSARALANLTSRVARALAARSVWAGASGLPIASCLLVVCELGTFFSFLLPFAFFIPEAEDGRSDLDICWMVDTVAVGSLVELDCGLGTFFSFPLSLILLVPDDEGDEDG